jgi:hypothetical protein
MKIKLFLTVGCFLVAAGIPTFFGEEDCPQFVYQKNNGIVNGNQFAVWEIQCPSVRTRTTRYDDIKIYPGDQIAIEAVGGVQTGGTGKTWKLYRDPSGPNSDRLYHGLIHVPIGSTPSLPASPTVKVNGLNMVRLQDVWKKGSKFTVPNDLRSPVLLVLGYEDDDYTDNGYYSHDDGTDDQCKNVRAARITITISHKAR